MKLFFKFSLVLSILFLSIHAYSWNALGHMVITNIAYDRLKPDVRKKVDKMVMDLNNEYPDITRFNHLAPWPDTIRSQKIEIHTHWHYIDIPFSDDGTPLKNITDTDNAVWAIGKLQPVISNNKANPYERARSLAFLVHIVGDIHQPLHTVTRVSAANPDGDEGGNLYRIKNPRDKSQSITLHRLWDQGMDVFSTDTSPESVDTLSRTIVALYPEEYFGNKAKDLTPYNWAQEGLSFAKSFVYTTPEQQVPDTKYLQSGREIAEQRVALAGYRLANLLNDLLA